MLNSLDWVMLIPMAVLVVCMIIILYKFKRYLKRVMIYQENNRQDIKILDNIKLRNKGHDLDKNIKYISDDEDIEFSMGVRDMIG